MIGGDGKDVIESSTDSMRVVKTDFGNVILPTTEENLTRRNYLKVVVKRGNDGNRGINFHEVI